VSAAAAAVAMRMMMMKVVVIIRPVRHGVTTRYGDYDVRFGY